MGNQDAMGTSCIGDCRGRKRVKDGPNDKKPFNASSLNGSTLLYVEDIVGLNGYFGAIDPMDGARLRMGMAFFFHASKLFFQFFEGQFEQLSFSFFVHFVHDQLIDQFIPSLRGFHHTHSS
jgi:hypothetical protein